jgi:hypothetical protein
VVYKIYAMACVSVSTVYRMLSWVYTVAEVMLICLVTNWLFTLCQIMLYGLLPCADKSSSTRGS